LFVFDNDALAGAAGLMIDLRYILYFVLVYAAVRLDRAFRRPFIIVAAAGAALVVGFAILQVTVLPDDILRHIGYGANTIQPHMTIDQNPNFVRINSTLRGPNPLGAYALVVLSIVAAAIVRRAILNPSAWRFVAIFLIIGSVVAIWFSYSRSALVGATAALLFILITTISAKISWKKMLIAVAAIGVLTGGILFTARDNHFVANVILHENPDSSSQSKSNDEHFASLIDGTERMVSQPFGAGVGSTGSASLYGDKPLIIENQYLFTAHESGWLGLVLYVAIFGIIMGRLWINRRDYLSFGLVVSGIGLSLIGLLLPVWADDTVAIVWWGLAGLAVGYMLKRKDEKSGRTIE
jgi:O-antigen ligase